MDAYSKESVRRRYSNKSYRFGNAGFSRGFWAVATLTAGVCGAASSTAAATYFWPDYYEPDLSYRAVTPHIHRPKKPRLPKTDNVLQDTRKPQGPLIIAISIEKQILKVYDANGAFAETPVSTGMRGHSTPMGVFSVIQKHKYHQSNIYSGAPMPYMQRITWSGVAMHAGALPGYPASHGCIRMPTNFAVKMWGWTRMGARIIIAPGELAPESFAHALLPTRKAIPVAAMELPKNVDVAVITKSDKGAIVHPPVKPAYSEASLELKSTVGHESARAVHSIHTADASTALTQPQSPLTVVDVPAAGRAPVEAKSSAADPRAAEAGHAGKPALIEQQKATESVALDATTAAGDAEAVGPSAKKDQSRAVDPDKPAASNPEPAIAAIPKRNGQIAVFVSRKDGKLYARQNFAPLFEAAVMIAPSDRPLGTHVFTAQADKDDAGLLRWSVVSMPAAARNAARSDDEERASQRRRTNGAIEVNPAPTPDSASEALDRLSIPADVMIRIAELLSSGGSIIVSDQGIGGGETGEGTDFIIPLR
ncbi:L,D-transpeptidase family protein [uncultured Bradyrhizobium sp.]|uniref:L,D-transpeptidase n=1 Tax=uncultured Bradyrhizobium sp. TaxID=199684 RepID=UPI0035CAB6A6